MIAAILAGILILCSLAIEQATDNKTTAILGKHPQGASREHPQEMVVKESSLPSQRVISSPIGQSTPEPGRIIQ